MEKDINTIRDNYQNVILKSDLFESEKPVKDVSLLCPDFYEILKKCFADYQSKYPEQEVCISETYRSNQLQYDYNEAGKSKIKKNGMHHYGIAADVAFMINGKFSYNGDYNYLRKLFKDSGLTVLNWELGHVQYIKVEEQNELRSEIGKL